jgi:hypothetical protein
VSAIPRAVAAALAAFLIVCWTFAGPARAAEPAPAERVMAWIKTYRAKPDRKLLPEAVIALGNSGAFQEPETAGVFVGFMAGVVASNPDQAEKLVKKMLKVRPEDNWAVIRAVAYSGLPDWRGVLSRTSSLAPNREAMIDAYINGKLATLDDFTVPEKRSTFSRMFGSDDESEKVVLTPSPVVMDTFWGYYYATGSIQPLSRIIALLPWSDDYDDAERLTLGSTAKYSLATTSSRDAELLAALKEARVHQPPKVVTHLDEVIFAAETAEMGKIKTDAMAALNELRAKGPAYKRKISWWGKAGEGAISLGCIGAAVAGMVAVGLPCVIGGATYSAAMRYMSSR